MKTTVILTSIIGVSKIREVNDSSDQISWLWQKVGAKFLWFYVL